MTPVIFAGPSLFGYRHMIPTGVEIRAPAGRGDLLLALRQGARQIGLVDGCFGDRPSVWHKEILLALSEGATVLGAASMGALRAAECSACGMIGVGQIFADYVHGLRTADADVAVLHAPEELSFAPLTVALVDAEAAIGWMESTCCVTHDQARLMHIAASDLNFRDRTWAAIRVAAGLPRQMGDRMESALLAMGPLPKTRDALDLVARITSSNIQTALPAIPRTHYLNDLDIAVRRSQRK